MRARIHRGAHEIGGSCVELEADGCRLVLDVGRPLSMYIGRNEVLLTLELEFDPWATAAAVVDAIAAIEAEIRRRFPVIRRIYIEASRLSRAEAPASA